MSSTRRRLVPAYLVTHGLHRRGAETGVDRLAVVSTAPPRSVGGTAVGGTADDEEVLDEDEARLVALVRPGPLALAEIAVHLGLPVSVAGLLARDLADRHLIMLRPPIPSADRPDAELLQRVIRGLNAQLRRA